MISELNELYDKKTKLYNEVEMIDQLIKTKIAGLDISDFKDFTYDELKSFMSKFSYRISQSNTKLNSQLNELKVIKKREKYPELNKPTYYPEINDLDLDMETKLKLDSFCRRNTRFQISKFLLDKPENKWVKSEYLEMLKDMGILEKKYELLCPNCMNSTLAIVDEKKLGKYLYYWDNKDEEFSDEYEESVRYGYISDYCFNCDNEIEIGSKEEFDNCNPKIFYKIIKAPDLTYEKL